MNKPDVAENGRVRHDPGIKGAEEGLNHGIDDWDDLVSQVIITRID